MARDADRIAQALGAEVVTPVPETGGGAFGAARLARIIAALRERLVPGQGDRSGWPTDPAWVRHPKVPMSEATERRLVELAEQASRGGRKISAMQLAAHLLEEALAQIPEVPGE